MEEDIQTKKSYWFKRRKLEIILFVLALVTFGATSADRMLKQSRAPHFVYLADSFLHGQAHLRVAPPNNNDWVRYNAKTWVTFPPVPAIFMMPFVAVFGRGFNDVLFTLPWAALNVVLMFLVLQMLSAQGLSLMSQKDNLWLTALFSVGTVHFSCAVMGEVWFTAQIIGVTFTLAYILAATRTRHPLLAGIFLALAFDTRVNLAFTAGYFLLQLYLPRFDDGRPAAGSKKEIVKKLVCFAIPILLVGTAQMVFNYARFHSLFEFGHSYLSGPAGSRMKEHGMFAYHYLEWNLRALLLRLPISLPHFPWIGFNPDGLSILITTPIFMRLFWPKSKPWLYPILWAAAIPSLLVPLLYQNSGYVQFGYRFSLDITPYLVMLLAVGRLPMTRWTKFWILIGIAINLAGAIALKRAGAI